MSLSEHSNLFSEYPLHEAIITLTTCLERMSLKAKGLAASSEEARLSKFLQVYEFQNEIANLIKELVMAIRFRPVDTSKLLTRHKNLVDQINIFLKDII